MRKVKLIITGLFTVLALVFLGSRFSAPIVSGQGALPAPTGVIASKGDYHDKVGVNWSAVRGATTYRVFRSQTNDPATAVNVATSPSIIDFDFSAVENVTYFYWVRAENGSTVSPFSAADQGFRVTGNVTGINPLNTPPQPFGNTVTAAKVYLGKTLFWDEQLSSTRTVSCGTCHIPGKGGSDPRSSVTNAASTHPGPDNTFNTADDVTGSPGVPLKTAAGLYDRSAFFGLNSQVTPRKSQSVINSAFATNALFWDGRATGIFRDPVTNALVIDTGGALESQSVVPPLASAEMAHAGRNWAQISSQITAAKPLALSPSIPEGLKTWLGQSTYPELFQEAFGSPEINASRIALAIASYERILNSDRTIFDKSTFTAQSGLTAAEQRGRGTFTARCTQCHTGAMFSDNAFHFIGVRPPNEDTGRFQVTGDNNDRGKFRTPDLRNVELRAPYFHNGRKATLEDVVDFYNRGGDFPNPEIPPLGLNAGQRADLVAFLRRPLTDPRVAAETPPFDRPALYTESTRVPVIQGTGVAGAGGIVPQPVAAEPPLVGNPGFTVGVSNALGGMQATLVIDSADPGTGPVIPSTGSFHRSVTVLGGAGNGSGFGSVSIAIPDNGALVGKTFFGRWYIGDSSAPGGVAVSPAFKFTVFGEAATQIARAKHADFDGDGKTDISVFRPDTGTWYIVNSSNGAFNASNLGTALDALVPEDYDGDGKTDVAVFRDGGWYIQRSRDGFIGVNFGQTGDKPQPADYDGDGIADTAVFRPSNGTWYINRSRDGAATIQFGLNGDRPVVGDYDGDGKADIAIYRNGIWYIQRSRDGLAAAQFGVAEDKPVVGDYDGDSKTDMAVFRPSTGVWYYLKSNDGSVGGNQFGVSTDLPSPGDYNGDGKYDLAVYRPQGGIWYILENTSGSFRVQFWGVAQDRSVPGAFVQ